MSFEYDDQRWDISPTTNDTNSLFHAAFGLRKGDDDSYIDDIAHIRRMNWQNFLSYYQNKQKPTFLKDTLQELFKSHGWSFENDKNFNKYIKFAGQERQVLLDELPLIASLENIKIVLFQEQTGPKIIEPSIEALTDYPLANTRPIETAVVVFKDSLYSKLTPQEQKLVDDGEKVHKEYKKMPIGVVTGIWYEINLLSIVLLNALAKYDIWRLSTSALKADCFDDLVLEFGPENSAFLLQAKWRKRKVHVRDFFDSKYSGFNLAKYFFAYQEVKKHYKVNNIVVCTNASIKFDWLKDFINSRDLTEHDLLYFEDCRSVCHTFKDSIIPFLLEKFKLSDSERHPQHLVNEEHLKDFLKVFQIISSYPRETSLEQGIENKIMQMGLCEKYDGLDYARHLNMKIMEWFDETNGEYLTPLHAKSFFCELRSSKLLAKLNKLDLALKSDILTTSKRISHIIPQNDYTLSLLRVSKFLANQEAKMLFLSTSETAQNQKMMAEAFQSKQYISLVVYKTELRQNVQELRDIIVRILNESHYKKVILIADQQDELAKTLKAHDGSIFEAIDDNVTFTDLTEKSQEQLLEKAVLFYEASL